MTFYDNRILDLTPFDNPEERPGRIDPSDLHTLRLVLDLQLDAMLLTLGAAAHADSQPDQRPGVQVDPYRHVESYHRAEDVPWSRWLAEDLEAARILATALVEGDAATAPGLGGGFSPVAVQTSLEHLVARYSSMERLLSDLMDRPNRSEPWRAPASEVLARSRARLEELHHHRRELITASAGSVGFLPGELLG